MFTIRKAFNRWYDSLNEPLRLFLVLLFVGPVGFISSMGTVCGLVIAVWVLVLLFLRWPISD